MTHSAISEATEANSTAWLAAAALLSVCAATMWPRPADACQPGYCFDRLVPGDGATNVSVDTHIWAFHDAAGGFLQDVELVVDETGETVPTSLTVYPAGNQHEEVANYATVVAPDSELSPQTTYRVTFGGHAACGVPKDKTFTTGEDSHGAASLQGTGTGSVSCKTRPGDPTSCSDQSIFPVYRFSVDTDGQSDAFVYKLLHDSNVVASSTGLPVVYHRPPSQTDDQECFRLKAVNQADEPSGDGTEVCIETTQISCPPDDSDGSADAGDTGDRDTGPMPDVAPDAHTDASGDVSSPPRDTTTEDTSTASSTRSNGADGCSCRSTASPSAPLSAPIAALAAIALFRLRRRNGPY